MSTLTIVLIIGASVQGVALIGLLIWCVAKDSSSSSQSMGSVSDSESDDEEMGSHNGRLIRGKTMNVNALNAEQVCNEQYGSR